MSAVVLGVVFLAGVGLVVALSWRRFLRRLHLMAAAAAATGQHAHARYRSPQIFHRYGAKWAGKRPFPLCAPRARRPRSPDGRGLSSERRNPIARLILFPSFFSFLLVDASLSASA